MPKVPKVLKVPKVKEAPSLLNLKFPTFKLLNQTPNFKLLTSNFRHFFLQALLSNTKISKFEVQILLTMSKFLLLIILPLLALHIFAQDPIKYLPQVRNTEKGYYKYPWAGGLNSAQFNEMDLDLDGVKDLMIFDRQGNRILPFINKGIASTIDYEYAPEYISLFPDITGWVLTADYNNDNKMDIFTFNALFINKFCR